MHILTVKYDINPQHGKVNTHASIISLTDLTLIFLGYDDIPAPITDAVAV